MFTYQKKNVENGTKKEEKEYSSGIQKKLKDTVYVLMEEKFH
jgi:hypothetical protein